MWQYLPASSNAGYGNDSSKMTEEDQATDTEHWSDGDVEASVAVQYHRVRAIQRHTLYHHTCCSSVTGH